MTIANWLGVVSPEAQAAFQFLQNVPYGLSGHELASLRRGPDRPRTACSSGASPLTRAELEVAFVSGYFGANFRDLVDAGHGRLLAGNPTWSAFASELLVAIAATEPGGASREAVRTLASPTQDGWTLRGRKDWVSRAQEADVVVVFARKPDDTIGGFVVSLPSEGVRLQRLEPSGLDGWSWSVMDLLDVPVGTGDEIEQTLSGHLARYRIVVSAIVVGVAASALDTFCERLRDKPSAPDRLAEVAAESRSTILACLAYVASNAGSMPSPASTKLLKAFVVPSCLGATRLLCSFSGASGYRLSDRIRQSVRDIEAYEHADGSTDALLRSAGHELLRGLSGTGPCAVVTDSEEIRVQ